jgi:hypothetical protein
VLDLEQAKAIEAKRYSLLEYEHTLSLSSVLEAQSYVEAEKKRRELLERDSVEMQLTIERSRQSLFYLFLSLSVSLPLSLSLSRSLALSLSRSLPLFYTHTHPHTLQMPGPPRHLIDKAALLESVEAERAQLRATMALCNEAKRTCAILERENQIALQVHGFLPH